MFAVTRVASGISCKDYACAPMQVSTLPVRQLKIRQLPNSPSTGWAKLTLFRTNSSKSIMAVVASPSVSGGEPTSISEFQWSGGVRLVLNCKVDAAWSLQRDFMGLTKWVPDISICTLDDGEPNAVGCLRYCKGSGTTWVHERLLEFDDATRFMSYRMEDNHFVFPQGFQNYASTVQLGDAGEGKTWAKWMYKVDPVATQTKEELTQFMVGFYTTNLQYLETGANKLVAEVTKEAAAKNCAGGWTSTQTPGTALVQG